MINESSPVHLSADYFNTDNCHWGGLRRHLQLIFYIYISDTLNAKRAPGLNFALSMTSLARHVTRSTDSSAGVN